MPRRHAGGHANHERWLVSYADFITLLFAFFVVMFATTQSDKAKAKAVSDSVKEALEHGELSAAISNVLGRGKHAPADPSSPPSPPPPPPPPPALAGQLPPADLAKTIEVLKAALAAEMKAGKIGMRLEGRGLIISLHESAFFASGDDAVSPASASMLARIAVEAQGMSNPIRLEGHTDAIPIHNSRFRSNWELSSARAIAMMELLHARHGIPDGRMSVAGYADHAPVESNDTAEGRARNRRVDLVVLSKEGEKSEPKPVNQSGHSEPQTAPAH